MSITSVLKNIYSFVEVLQASSTDAVGGWDTQALQNALQWATYSEQIFQKSKGKPYAEELDRQITLLGKLPLALGNFSLSLGFLENCKEILTMTLLQNPHLNDELFEVLVTANDTRMDSFLNSCFTVSESKSGLNLALLLKDEIIQSKELTSEMQPSIVLRAQASLLYKHVKKVFQDCHSTGSAEQYVNDKLDGLLKEDTGMEVLLYSLLAMDLHGQEEQTAHQYLLEYILQAVNQRMTSSSKDNHLLHIPPSLLTDVSVQYHSFFQIYLKCLSHWINTSTEEKSEEGQDCSSKNTNFESYVDRIRQMMKVKPFITSNVWTWLSENEDGCGEQPNIWTQIVKQLTQEQQSSQTS